MSPRDGVAARSNLREKGTFMLGTLVNVGAIVAGSFLGGMARRGIRAAYQEALFVAMGLAATGLGINAVVQNMPRSGFPVLFILSLASGGLAGTMLDVEARFQRLAGRFSTGNLAQGLSTAILLFCIGTLSILGPMQSALRGDNTYLFTNATLDFVTSMALAATYGPGIAFAAVVLFCWQGSIYWGAGALSGFLVPELMTELSIVGGFLIAASGLAILKIKDCRTLNLLPALLVPPLWFLLKGLLGLG